MSGNKFNPSDSILATIVLFNTSLEQSATFKTLSASLKSTSGKMDILVYDNSSSSHAKVVKSAQWNIHYIHDPTNPGVSRAYNEGFKLAQKLKKRWMLLLDQDTSFPLNAIARYSEVISTPKTALAAPILKANQTIISPFRHFHGRGRPTKSITNGMYKLGEWIAVNSGLLIKTDAFARAGGYNELITLDYSDFSFMYRLKKHFSQIQVLDMTCEHGFFDSSLEKTREQTIDRFKYYCQGVKMIYHETGDFLYLVTAFGRTLKLTMKYQSLKYLKLFLKM